jgi:SRSO17 transposase
MIDRLAEFVVPYRQALETEVAQRNMHLYLKGLLSHLPRKNAEDIATFVDVQRQVIQEFIGIAPWDHRPLIEVLVPQVARRLGQPDGIIAFDPSSFPKRGTHSVGVKRQWCSHRVVYLSPADKYPRLTHRLSQEQKGLDERVVMAS